MTDATPEPLIPDGWELRPGGTAMLSIAGRRLSLKAPTFGELRQVSEAIEAASDSITVTAHELDARQAETRQARDRGDLDAGQAALQDRKFGREFNAHVEQVWWEALCQVFDLLGSARLPPKDDLPAWVVASAADQIAALVGHWKSGPKARGVH